MRPPASHIHGVTPAKAGAHPEVVPRHLELQSPPWPGPDLRRDDIEPAERTASHPHLTSSFTSPLVGEGGRGVPHALTSGAPRG